MQNISTLEDKQMWLEAAKLIVSFYLEDSGEAKEITRKKILDIAKLYERNYWFEQGFKEGFEEGFQEGKIEMKQMIAVKMLNKGTDIDYIVEITELSKSEILRLKSEIDDRKN